MFTIPRSFRCVRVDTCTHNHSHTHTHTHARNCLTRRGCFGFTACFSACIVSNEALPLPKRNNKSLRTGTPYSWVGSFHVLPIRPQQGPIPGVETSHRTSNCQLSIVLLWALRIIDAHLFHHNYQLGLLLSHSCDIVDFWGVMAILCASSFFPFQFFCALSTLEPCQGAIFGPEGSCGKGCELRVYISGSTDWPREGDCGLHGFGSPIAINRPLLRRSAGCVWSSELS